MTTLADFPITAKWPPQDPTAIQLYSRATPNGRKVAAMLEETGLAYEAHMVSFADDEQFSDAFLSLNPNNKIPAIIDPEGPGGAPLGLWESGAILLYLAEKADMLLPRDPALRHETQQWLMWQMGGLGPMVGQLGWFHAGGGREFEDRRPFERYRDEARRLLTVLDRRLAGREYVMGDAYTIADIAIFPWVDAIDDAYEAGDAVGLDDFEEIDRWRDALEDRPAHVRARNIPR